MELVAQRMLNQRLSGQQLEQPEDVVRWMGAVQGQEYLGAKWALAQRMLTPSDDAIEQAFTDGKILRTHVMRPTWHLVMPDDIRWLQMLTAPRVHALNAYMYRQSGLDSALLVRGCDIIVKALAGGNHLTRREIQTVLKNADIQADGFRLGYLIHYAELEAIVCSGGRRGKQFTYALIAERAPNARILSRDEALAELTTRYFASHGPASVHDFAWWSGLTIADIKMGIESVRGQLESMELNGQTYWMAKDNPFVLGEQKNENDLHRPTAYLLPTYDEYVIGYTDRSLMFPETEVRQPGARRETAFDSIILIDGWAVGTWRREVKGKNLHIETEWFHTPSAEEQAAFDAAAERYARYLGVSRNET